MATPSLATSMLRDRDRRVRSTLLSLCVALGIGLAEIGLVAWAIRVDAANAGSLVALGMIPAGILGFVFGLVAALFVPIGLYRKPLKRAFWTLTAWTTAITVAFTAATGAFPLFIAGISLSVTTWVMAICMRNEVVEIAWSATRCVACKYDLRGAPPARCPECGITQADVRAVTLMRARESPRLVTAVWLALPVAAWIVISIWALSEAMMYPI